MTKHSVGACILIAGVLAACWDGGDVCTENFVVIQVVVVDSSRRAVNGLTISDTVVRTGHGFSEQQWPGGDPYRYIILTDGDRPHLPPGDELVRVTGSNGVVGFSEVFLFLRSECHLTKVSGPDTVIVSPL